MNEVFKSSSPFRRFDVGRDVRCLTSVYMFNWLVMSPHLVWGLDITSWAKRICHVLCCQTCHDFHSLRVVFRLPVKP